MTTPMVPIIPKIIVALGESTGIVRTGGGVAVGIENIVSDLEERTREVSTGSDMVKIEGPMMAICK
jgi:hypothetical protein